MRYRHGLIVAAIAIQNAFDYGRIASDCPKLVLSKPEKDWEQRKYKKPKKGKKK